MGNRKYGFVAGLPRSGSTVLCNILAQNPRFRSDGITSGLLDIIGTIRDKWALIPEFRNWPYPEAQKRVMRAAFHSFYMDTDHPVVFDKFRGWTSHLELAEMLLEAKARVIVMVRDMRAIMASWEKLWRKSKAIAGSNIPLASETAVMDRVKHWSSQGEPTGFAFLSIQDAIQRGYGDRMLFVDFDRLTREPERQMKRIYEFMEEDFYLHDFENIEQRNLEKDPEPWMKDLHIIRKRLEPAPWDWDPILGPAVVRLEEANQLWLDRV